MKRPTADRYTRSLGGLTILFGLHIYDAGSVPMMAIGITLSLAGIGQVAGTWCVVSGNDPTVKGGAQSPTSVRKVLRAMEVARENRLPLVNLTETASVSDSNRLKNQLLGLLLHR